MSGPRISIVPADAEKTISLNPNVGIDDIKVSSKRRVQKKSLQKQPQKQFQFDDDDDDDESIQFGKKVHKSNEFPNANEYEESELSSVSSFKGDNDEGGKHDSGDPFLSNISNPMKTRHHDEIEDDEDDDFQKPSFQKQDDDIQSERNEYEQNEYETQKDFYKDDKKRLMEEKQELLYKFYRLEQRGIRSSRRFTMESNLEDMKIEYSKLTRQIEVEQSIKFQRRALMAIVSGLEFLNKRYDPFDVKLDGWSESIMESVEEYDNVFERLHEKYKSKSEMAPEIELMLSLAGSAFMFHLTKTLFKSAMPNMADIAKQNPELMQNVAQAMMENMASQRKQPSEPMKEGAPPDVTGPPAPVNPRREMKGPSIQAPGLGGAGPLGGLGALGGGAGGLGEMMQQLGPLGNMMQDMLGNLGNQQFAPPMNYPQGPPMPQFSRPQTVIDDDNQSDGNISDITSVSSITFGNPTKTKDILISGNESKKRGRKGRSKNEVTLNI